ncbi:MAG: hypothetical protein CVV64_08990 [Candidatus Wallbacteria bacterium HGW-Wallbacteria-1]|jgi:hypothetical protein|uniref:Uncharacterized protein n=1 Tax=Candidatus Wallbacteria bacterium HGW-Wallbacteria-1 TaxID=2013854 RepID=A0A2N1PQ72_9BACT|nr:MAG: hypothetical protein CVV64_08990 [Candidatus Wallbacteria bacterium HGW-Wallbacteria-1]
MVKGIYDERGEMLGYVVEDGIFQGESRTGTLKDNMVHDLAGNYLGKWTGTDESGKIWDIGFDRFGYQIGRTCLNSSPNPIDRGNYLILNNYGNVVGTTDIPQAGAAHLLLFYRERYPVGHRLSSEDSTDRTVHFHEDGDRQPIVARLRNLDLSHRITHLRQDFSNLMETYSKHPRLQPFSSVIIAFGKNILTDLDSKTSQWMEHSSDGEQLITERAGMSLMDELLVYSGWRDLDRAVGARLTGVRGRAMELARRVCEECYSGFLERAQVAGGGKLWSPGRVRVMPWPSHTHEDGFAINYVRCPVALLAIPMDQTFSPWNWPAIGHEIGHDIYHNVEGLKSEIKYSLYDFLGKNCPDQVASLWFIWREQLFADLMGVMIFGPAFTMSFQAEFLSLAGILTPVWNGLKNRWDGHPLTLFRNALQVETLNRLGFSRVAQILQRRWNSMYQKLDYLHLDREKVDMESFSIPLEGMVDIFLKRPMSSLGGKTVGELVNYGEAEYRKALTAAKKLLEGQASGFPETVHLVSGARIAFENHPEKSQTILKGVWASVAEPWG